MRPVHELLVSQLVRVLVGRKTTEFLEVRVLRLRGLLYLLVMLKGSVH